MNINQEKIRQFSKLELLARQVVEGFITGLHKSPFHGFSVEFAEHRHYNKGESVRHVDWKLFARTDKMFVKTYEEETNLRCQIVIDRSSSMYFPVVKDSFNSDVQNKMSFSIHCAASIVQLLKKQRDAIGLTVFGDKVDMHTNAKSSQVHQRMLFTEMDRLLQPISEDVKVETNAADALHLIAESIHKRSLVVIFSDMMGSAESQDDLFSALQHLKHNKHEVILFHVADYAKELDFEFDNKSYQFVDLETGQEVKVNPNEVKANYVSAMKAHQKELSLKCAQFKIDFVEADINLDFEQVLLPYLIKRDKMH
ncbi:MAG: DUF58 domain-containing protein [Flavobacteriales bacterium]|nr:DUF58 domain-containing protein [Flavobacteriales bacterium]